jgi:hypothetical protein
MTQGDLNPSKQVMVNYENTLSSDALYCDIHPAVHDLGVKLVSNKLTSTNQITVSIILALKEVIADF